MVVFLKGDRGTSFLFSDSSFVKTGLIIAITIRSIGLSYLFPIFV